MRSGGNWRMGDDNEHAVVLANVIAGLDPAIHHRKKSLAQIDGMRGSSPRMTRKGQPMTPLEKIRSMKMPFAELKGVTFTEADKDRVVAQMLVRPDLCTLNH